MEIVKQITVEFGIIKPYPQTDIFYDGEDDSGVTIVIDTFGPASNIRVNRTSGGEFLSIDSEKLARVVGSGIQEYDHIEINTRRGRKSASMSRNGVKYNILRAISSSDRWIHLEKGNNTFTFTAESGLDNLRIHLEYTERYNGV